MNWQPIETLKPDIEVLLAANLNNEKFIVIGHLYAGYDGAKCWNIEHRNEEVEDEALFTNWMPLPQPPKETNNDN